MGLLTYSSMFGVIPYQYTNPHAQHQSLFKILDSGQARMTIGDPIASLQNDRIEIAALRPVPDGTGLRSQ